MFPHTYTPNIVVDLFPTTFKTRKYQNALGKVRNRIKHQSERVVACGVCSIADQKLVSVIKQSSSFDMYQSCFLIWFLKKLDGGFEMRVVWVWIILSLCS